MVNNWIDVTQTLEKGIVHWPSLPEPEFRQVSSLEKGDMANSTHLSFNAHTGTHMDAPLHFVKGGADISEMPFEAMTGKVIVLEISDGRNITRDTIAEAERRVGEISAGGKAIFKTSFSALNWRLKPFIKEYPGLEADAAHYLVEKKVLLAGIDYLSMAPFNNLVEVHEILLGNNVWIIEGLKLDEITEGEYEMIAMPLKIKGSDGSPARVFLKKL